MLDEIATTVLAWLGGLVLLALLLSGVMYWVDQFNRIPAPASRQVENQEYRFPNFPPAPPLYPALPK